MRTLRKINLLAAFVTAGFNCFSQQLASAKHSGAPINNAIKAGAFLFEENLGQWPEQVLFKGDLQGATRVFFERDRFTYVLYDMAQVDAVHENSHSTNKIDFSTKINMHAFQMRFVGATVQDISKKNESAFYSNYYIGNDESKWATGVKNYSEVTYEQLYPGINMVLRENNGSLKYDYVVQAGANPANIELEVIGLKNCNIVDGRLSLQTSVGELLESIPICYQVVDGTKVEVPCVYKLSKDKQHISFSFPKGYNKEFDLIIDPVVVGASYSGSVSQNFGHCATYDAAGNIYSGARSFGTSYPVSTGAFQTAYGGNVDIAISKLSPNAAALIYATYLGGNSSDLPHSMFVTVGTNELLVYSSSTSANYPTSAGAFDATANGSNDMVITRLNSTGTALVGSTYVGGSGDDGANNAVSVNYGDTFRGEIIADNSGNVYVTGASASSNFPVTTGAYNTTFGGIQDAVVLKLNPTLSGLLWATYLGGTAADVGCSLRLHSNGDVYVVGGTKGANFPSTPGSVGTTYNGGTHDAFVARISANGASLLNCAIIGTSLMDIIYFIDLDYNNDVYVYGVSDGSIPISTGVYSNPGSQNFIMKLNSTLSAYVFRTVLGNGQHITFSPSALMVDYCQNIYICGWGIRSNYPVTANATQTTSPSSSFQLMVLSQNAATLLYSSPYGSGGEHVDGGTSRFDKNGIVYQAVCACSPNFPTTPGSYSPTKLSSGCDIVVFKINFEVNCDAFSPSTQICYGSTASFTIPNLSSLQSPTFVVQPSNISNSTGFFSFSPTVTSQYTVSISGYNTINALVTTTGIITVTVLPMPVLTPSITQSSCTNSVTTIALNLSYLPTTASAVYTVQWLPIPNGITTNTQLSVTGFISPGAYQATVTTAGGCVTSTIFTVDPIPTVPSFTLIGPYDITCDSPIRTVSATPASNNYTWSSGTTFQTGAVASFSAVNAGSIIVIVTPSGGGCVASQVFSINLNVTPITATVLPLMQTINCSLAAAANVTAVLSPSANCSSYWMSPLGGTLVSTGGTSIYNPLVPGTHTHIAVNLTNGCKLVTTFTLSTNTGFPTYTVNSPQNFTLGCTTKSVATINIINGQTTPPGGAVSYTLLAPGFTGSYGTGTISTYTNIIAPGQYTVVTKDNVSLCESKAVITVLQNTAAPNMQLVIPYLILNCNFPSVVLQALSNTPNVSYNWRFSNPSINLPSDTIRVGVNSVVNNTLAGTYSLTITNNNNTCVSNTIIPVLQNTSRPNVLFTGVAPISCKVREVTLTNQSTSNVPAVFNPTGAVVGYEWQGPTPQLLLQLSTTYKGLVPGTYTLIGKDLNNGCINTYTAIIEDNRDYPAIKRPASVFIIPCGSTLVSIYPTILNETKGLQYQWLPNGDASFTSMNTATTGVNKEGHYDIVVTNTINGCVSAGMVMVEEDTLFASLTADKFQGFVPLTVTFTNLTTMSSSNKNNLDASKCHWSFGNGNVSAVNGSINPAATYNAPGNYTVKLFVNAGGCADTASIRIKVDLPSRLIVPNVFTPNGDNANDVFFVDAINLAFIHIKIVDRWGHLVYELESESGNISWDGKNQQGKNCSDGTYMYTITASGSDGETYDQSGTITLIR